MNVLTAPEENPIAAPSLLLTGGMSNCGDWQGDYVTLLRGTGLTLLNPRRDDLT